jgi:hypothetical protein
MGVCMYHVWFMKMLFCNVSHGPHKTGCCAFVKYPAWISNPDLAHLHSIHSCMDYPHSCWWCPWLSIRWPLWYSCLGPSWLTWVLPTECTLCTLVRQYRCILMLCYVKGDDSTSTPFLMFIGCFPPIPQCCSLIVLFHRYCTVMNYKHDEHHAQNEILPTVGELRPFRSA